MEGKGSEEKQLVKRNRFFFLIKPVEATIQGFIIKN